MIIVITNRKLPELPTTQTKDINVTDMGVVLSERTGNEDVIHTGLVSDDDNKITFYPRGKEAGLFSSISDAERKRPWVFFIHGFHQDPEENIMKARMVHNHHKVNIIAFAWPSRPLDKTYKIDSNVDSQVLDVIRGASVQTMALSYLKYKVIGYLRDSGENYEPAIKNAESSHVDLEAAFKLVSENLKSTKPPVLLVHSMGNYLLQNAVNQQINFNMKFANILLHQADVNAEGHEWVIKLLNYLDDSLDTPAKLFITTNKLDYVLFSSCARRALLQKNKAERLGQTRHHYQVGNIHYLDFSDAPKISKDHEMFRRHKKKTNQHVFDCLGRIYRNEPDLLPGRDGKSNAGFSKMPTMIQLFRLQELLDPVEYDDGSFDDETETVSSLSQFEDPLKAEETVMDDDWE